MLSTERWFIQWIALSILQTNVARTLIFLAAKVSFRVANKKKAFVFCKDCILYQQLLRSENRCIHRFWMVYQVRILSNRQHILQKFHLIQGHFKEQSFKGGKLFCFIFIAQDEDPESQNNQAKRLQGLKNSLKKHNINLEIGYSTTLHDREIRFNNGWIIKIGRGLDYFKAPPGKFCIGFCDFNLRECHETAIDIYLKKG